MNWLFAFMFANIAISFVHVCACFVWDFSGRNRVRYWMSEHPKTWIIPLDIVVWLAVFFVFALNVDIS